MKKKKNTTLGQSRVNEPVPSATEINAQVVPPGTSLSTTIAQDAPSTSASSSTSDIQTSSPTSRKLAKEPLLEDTQSYMIGTPTKLTTSRYISEGWTKIISLDNIVGQSLSSCINQKQLASDACGGRSIDFEESFAPVARNRGHQNIRIANAATRTMIILSDDVKLLF
ncbi:hypothetical protein Tco_0228086 [Tanacetum coccineum]